MTQDLGDIRSACHAGDEDALIKAMVAYRAPHAEDLDHVLTYIKGAMGYVPIGEWRMMPPEHTEDGKESPQEMLLATMRNRMLDDEGHHIRACAVLSGCYATLRDWPDMHQALVRVCLPMLEELSEMYVPCTPTLERYAYDARRCLAIHQLHAEDAGHPSLSSEYRINGASLPGSVLTRQAATLYPGRPDAAVERFHRIAFAFVYPAFTPYEMWDDALGVKPGTSKRRILTGLGLLP